MAIEVFSDKHSFLSNFQHCEIWFEGLKYNSAEAAYQAAKTTDIKIREKFTTLSASKAKAEGKKLVIRADWDEVKLSIMETIVREKFSRNIGLQELLLTTGDEELIEGNWWGDTFWGVCKGVGSNHLGKILMKIRGEIKVKKLLNSLDKS